MSVAQHNTCPMCGVWLEPGKVFVVISRPFALIADPPRWTSPIETVELCSHDCADAHQALKFQAESHGRPDPRLSTAHRPDWHTSPIGAWTPVIPGITGVPDQWTLDHMPYDDLCAWRIRRIETLHRFGAYRPGCGLRL